MIFLHRCFVLYITVTSFIREIQSEFPADSPNEFPATRKSRKEKYSRNACIADLQTAVNLWVTDQVQAEEEYGSIEDWNVECVTSMVKLFCGDNSSCSSANASMKNFNADISKWNVRRVTNMSLMFRGADSFNVDISKWNVGAVTSMRRMFYQTDSFQIDLCGWGNKVLPEVNVHQMFEQSMCLNEDDPTPTTLPPDNWCFDCMPSDKPSSMPSDKPTLMPSDKPTLMPSDKPTLMPSDMPSDKPTLMPSDMPSDKPSLMPSDMPSDKPSLMPSDEPTLSDKPSLKPNDEHSLIFQKVAPKKNKKFKKKKHSFYMRQKSKKKKNNYRTR